MTTTMGKALDAVAKLAPQDNEPDNRYKLIVHYTTSDYAEVLVHAPSIAEAKKKAEALWRKENPQTQVIAVEMP